MIDFIATATMQEAQGGFSLETAAEEVLNGLFCHYEPPTSEKAQKLAAHEVLKNPAKFGMPKQSKSILRPSRLYKKPKSHARSVTWRDEAQKSDKIEGQAIACANSCDLFGKSTTGEGLADTLVPVPVPVPDENVQNHANSMPQEQESNKNDTSTAPLKKIDDPPKKILYDDEGNPIHEDGTEPQDHSPRSLDRLEMSTSRDDPFFVGRGEGRGRYGYNDDADFYEPENYDRPPSAHNFRRVRSPPVRNATPRYSNDEDETESEFLERVGRRVRSHSPSRRRYDDEDDNVGRSPRNKGWMKRFRRPQTPHRHRGNGDDEDYESDNDGSLVDRVGRISLGRRRSSSRERVRDREYDDEYYRGRNRRSSRSPSRRSEREDAYYEDRRGRSPSRRSEFSDLTDDYGFEQTPRGRGRSKSPGRPGKSQSFMEDGVEVDYNDDAPPPLSSQPTKDFDDRRRSRDHGEEQELRHVSPQEYEEDRIREEDRRRSKDYGEDVDRRRSKDYDDRRSSREHNDRRMSTDKEDRRRSRDGGMRMLDEEENVAPPISPRSKRRWKLGSKSRDEREDEVDREAPRSSKSRYEEDYYDDDRRYEDRRSSRRVSDPIRSRRPQIDTDEPDHDANERRRPHTTSHSSRRGPLPIDTSYDVEDNAGRNRDPTPRMSMDPTDDDRDAQKSNELLPPTPRERPERDEREDRRKSYDDRERRSRRKEDRDDHRAQDREERVHENGDRDGRRPQPLDVNEGMSSKVESSFRQLMKQLSPTSMATDAEIREEVSSVGMESHTLRPIQYPNPFLQVPPPVLEDLEERDDEEGDEETDHDPSTLSSATLSKEHPNLTKRKKVPDGIDPSSSTSTKTKKIWKGWKNAIGKVKHIVKEIDENRLPSPIRLPRVQSKPSSSSSGKKKQVVRE